LFILVISLYDNDKKLYLIYKYEMDKKKS